VVTDQHILTAQQVGKTLRTRHGNQSRGTPGKRLLADSSNG
jgi:hypothetical protein